MDQMRGCKLMIIPRPRITPLDGAKIFFAMSNKLLTSEIIAFI
jgi:hypothetical protein